MTKKQTEQLVEKPVRVVKPKTYFVVVNGDSIEQFTGPTAKADAMASVGEWLDNGKTDIKIFSATERELKIKTQRKLSF